MIVGVVADDITGANDIGIMFAKAGWVAHVYPYDGPEALARAPRTDEAHVLILDTDSRFDAPDVAYEKVAGATRALLAAGCTRFYNKTCSVFRGNIGAEFDAMLDALNEPFALVVLGFPKNGRRTLDGVHWVHGKRLEESEFRHDPMHPMTRSNLVDILQAQTHRRVSLLTHERIAEGATALAQSIEGMRAQGGYLILDVPDQAALATIAQAARGYPVLCGSSALAEELPAVWPSPTRPAASVQLPGASGAGVLCVAGSLMPQTAAQLRHLRQGEVPTWELDTRRLLEPAERPHLLAGLIGAMRPLLARGTDVLLHAANDPEIVAQTRAGGSALGLARGEVARLVSGALAEIVAALVEDTGVNRLVIAGGDTSAAICARLGVRGLRVWQEIQPGLPSCLSLDEPTRLLVLKSGSFGSPDFLEQAMAHVKQ